MSIFSCPKTCLVLRSSDSDEDLDHQPTSSPTMSLDYNYTEAWIPIGCTHPTTECGRGSNFSITLGIWMTPLLDNFSYKTPLTGLAEFFLAQYSYLRCLCPTFLPPSLPLSFTQTCKTNDSFPALSSFFLTLSHKPFP